MMVRTPLKDRARGRWKSIIPMLGLADIKTLSGKHGPCPFCGGKDRFRFDDKDGTGTFFCSQCGPGDGVEFVMRKTGMDFRQAAAKIEGVIGGAAVSAAPAQRDERQRRENLNKLWAESQPVRPSDPVSAFHTGRTLRLPKYPACLRYHPNVMHRDGATGEITFHPAMIAMVQDPDGRPSTLHRTYLTSAGRKASVDCPRKLMPGGLAKGGAIRLATAGEVLGIAEGIETALAASIVFDVPVWAAVNAGNLSAWCPPSGVKQVIVFGDNDPSFTGQAAAYALASKIKNIGVQADVQIPSAGGDWNEWVINAKPCPLAAA
jgi:putative DNA primase/helicase